MEDKEFDLESEYNGLKEKHSLPDFKKLAEDFDVEKISEKESSFLIREIRRIINEKLSAYMHLFETLINPSAPPMFIFSVLRGIKEEDKESIKEIYKKLSRLQIKAMKLDTIYSEQGEVEFVKTSFTEWQDLKKTIYRIIEQFGENIEKSDNSKKRSYFD
ncbi:MAG: hypothetical protein KKF50_05190 [Nanoarchaeota archaeon]|nr:hypothetical protein [Nanoarchaeota archaeon]